MIRPISGQNGPNPSLGRFGGRHRVQFSSCWHRIVVLMQSRCAPHRFRVHSECACVDLFVGRLYCCLVTTCCGPSQCVCDGRKWLHVPCHGIVGCLVWLSGCFGDCKWELQFANLGLEGMVMCDPCARSFLVA